VSQTIAAMERRFQVLSGILDGLRDPDAKKPDD
jgi:hypothetical protein